MVVSGWELTVCLGFEPGRWCLLKVCEGFLARWLKKFWYRFLCKLALVGVVGEGTSQDVVELLSWHTC